ncbi:MAG TPA: lytic transglycosylase domain-containing protein [Clostridia bacterium]
MKLNIRVDDILSQKISDIQSRVPMPVKVSLPSVSFSNILNQAIEKTTNRILDLDTSIKKYPLVSGSYEAEYPRLSADEISALMPRIDEAIANASKKYGVDENMIRAIIKQESSFQPFALSTSGAMGLMQLMPDTAKWLSVNDPYSIEQNIMGGTHYFKEQLDAFGDMELALAAYNAGPNKVRRYNGIPPVQQTQNFVKNVLRYYQLYNSAQKSPASLK